MGLAWGLLGSTGGSSPKADAKPSPSPTATVAVTADPAVSPSAATVEVDFTPAEMQKTWTPILTQLSDTMGPITASRCLPPNAMSDCETVSATLESAADKLTEQIDDRPEFDELAGYIAKVKAARLAFTSHGCATAPSDQSECLAAERVLAWGPQSLLTGVNAAAADSAG